MTKILHFIVNERQKKDIPEQVRFNGVVVVLLTLDLFLNTTWIEACKMQTRKASISSIMVKFKVLFVTSRKASPKGFNFTDLCNNWFSFYTLLTKKKRSKATRKCRIGGIKKCLNNQVSKYRPWVC